jgi:putative hemolysin
MLIWELLAVAVLIFANGFFAMSELAVVSSRRPRLVALASTGSTGAEVALRLLDHPGRFLSSVQIGITLIGILAGAFSGATLGLRLAGWLVDLGLSSTVAEAVAVGAVVAVLTYFSLIVGELVPKQIALRRPEVIAAAVARPMTGLAKLASPVISLLELSSRLLLRALGQVDTGEQRVTEQEIRALIAEAESAGVVEPQEKSMITRVMRLGDRSVRGLMTPRLDVDWLDLDEAAPMVLARLRASPHSRLPAARATIDQVLGVVHTKDVMAVLADAETVDFASLLRSPPTVHDNQDALDALESLRKAPVDMAFVVDEYGAFAGLITSADLLEAIAGRFADESGVFEPAAVQRPDGSWLLDAMMSSDEMSELLKLALPDPATQDYHTVAGFVLSHLGRIPHAGDAFEWAGWRIEVVDMDGQRIDKVLAQPLRQ